MSPNRKRDRSVFQSVQELDKEDAIAMTARRSSSLKQKQHSLAAVSQQKIHTKLLEVRILLQRAIQQSKGKNDVFDKGDDQQSEGETERNEAIQQCNELLKSLLVARETLLHSGDDHDVEHTNYSSILADSEALEHTLEKEYKDLEKDWEYVLNRRHKEVRLHAGLTSKSQFRVLDSSFWEQVQQNVRHEEFVKRKNIDNQDKGTLQDFFDDTKIYQQLLKDFLSSVSGDAPSLPAADAATRTTQRRKTTANNDVDRRASKGRKIRYTPTPKLANFTFPLSRPTTGNMLDEDAWFRSLFGGAAALRTKKRPVRSEKASVTADEE